MFSFMIYYGVSFLASFLCKIWWSAYLNFTILLIIILRSMNSMNCVCVGTCNYVMVSCLNSVCFYTLDCNSTCNYAALNLFLFLCFQFLSSFCFSWILRTPMRHVANPCWKYRCFAAVVLVVLVASSVCFPGISWYLLELLVTH